MENVTVSFNWKSSAEAAQQSATITLDLSALSQEDFNEYAYADMIVQAQGKMRAWMKTDGSKERPWVDGGTYVVKPKGTKALKDPESIKADVMKQLKKLTPEQLADFLAALG